MMINPVNALIGEIPGSELCYNINNVCVYIGTYWILSRSFVRPTRFGTNCSSPIGYAKLLN